MSVVKGRRKFVTLDILHERGVPLDHQVFTWRDMVRTPISKLDEDAFTRVRVILMNGIESEAVRFSHAAARMNRDLQLPLAQIRRIEQHEQTLVNWLLPADQSPLETTIGYEQVAIEVTAALAQQEPDPYVSQVLRFGLLEDFDHLYRYSALLDRLEGKDANTLTQGYTDIIPGRPTIIEHRAPEDDLRRSYDRMTAQPITKLNTMTIVSGEHQTHDYYMHVGPLFADPVARMLYAEIASIEEQHVTQYECLCDPTESWLEKWLLHEANEVYNYYSCVSSESNPRIRSLWERFLDYELGHLHFAMEQFKNVERRDPSEILPATLPDPIVYESQRAYVRQVLHDEVNLQAVGTEIVEQSRVPVGSPSTRYREQLNSEGSPSEITAAGYMWTPGTELAKPAGWRPAMPEQEAA
jgi:rubrerythrin